MTTLFEQRDHHTYIIAELSCNHVGSFRVAEQTFRAVATAGADAVKIQTDTLLEGTGSTIQCTNDYFTINDGTIWDGKNLFELYMETYTPIEWHSDLKGLAEELGLDFLSTPYSVESADMLDQLGVQMFKIASMELMDLPFVRHVAAKGKPVILSRGMSEAEEIEAAVDACRSVGNDRIAVLQCVSQYPTRFQDANVSAVRTIRDTFNVLTGVSDHTPGSTVPVLSVAYGGQIVEKHVTISRRLGGPDAAFSMEIDEFSSMIADIRNAEQAIGDGSLVHADDTKRQRYARRSLFVVQDIEQGEPFTKQNVRSIRPGDGLDPNLIDSVVGKKATRSLEKGTPLSERDIDNFAL